MDSIWKDTYKTCELVWQNQSDESLAQWFFWLYPRVSALWRAALLNEALVEARMRYIKMILSCEKEASAPAFVFYFVVWNGVQYW